MTLLTTVLAFLVTLGILIVIHELGHYWVARRCGVKVLRFSVGFGRPLARWVRGPDRTEWVVSAIPLGGYVRMLDERDGDQGPISAADLPRAFNRQSVGKRIAIVLAGPLANLLLAVAVYWGLNLVGVMEPRALLGAPTADSPAAQAGVRPGDTVVAIDGEPVRSWTDLRWQLLQHAVDRRAVDLLVDTPSATQRELRLELAHLTQADIESDLLGRLGLQPYVGAPRIARLADDGAAARAGLQEGDQVVGVARHDINSARELIERIRAAGGQPLDLLVRRDDGTRSIMVTPVRTVDDAGNVVGRIGAELNDRPPPVRVQYGPIEGLRLAFHRTVDTAVFSVRMLFRMLTGEASWKNLSGPVTIADYAGQTARIGVVAYLGFLALVSISLGVLNLLPVPMLDGGHLLYYLIEIFKGSPPSDRFVEWGQRAGIALLAMLTALALYNDLLRLLT